MVSSVLLLLLLCIVCCQLSESRILNNTEKGNTTDTAFAKTRRLAKKSGKGGIGFFDILTIVDLATSLVLLGVSGKHIFDFVGTSFTCKRCIKAHSVHAGSIEDACVSSIPDCQNYFNAMQAQCSEECPREEVMKPVHSYLYKIREQEADKYYEIIEAANSAEDLAPAVEYAKQLKVLEISRGFRFGKKLSKKITKAIKAREAVLAKQT